MRLALHLLVFVLVVSMGPGLLEVMYDGVHLLLAGNTDHMERESSCAERGCTPACHHCGCCSSIAIAAPPEMAALRQAEPSERSWLLPVEASGPRGVSVPLERPPIV